MSGKESDWKYAEEFVVESDEILQARTDANELGIDSISPGVGAQLGLLASATVATNIIEVGTGAGVSGLWLLTGAPQATLTTIDIEADFQQHAKRSFVSAGANQNKIRLITGRALEVLPRMNEDSYDLVFIDADPISVIEYVEHGLRLVRNGGVVAVAHALWRGHVANPAYRDEVVTSFRNLLHEISASSAVMSSLVPVGDGLLLLSRNES
ncbi:MAG: O-methyltransferase [Microbacteriaceae bacterium]|nr:O-methyltransferase [Microbacteriaceae bacterium]